MYQQTNPYTKKSTKQFSTYLKKIQNAINNAPLITEVPKQASPLEKRLFVDSATDDSIDISKDVEIGMDASLSSKDGSDEANLPSTTIAEDRRSPDSGCSPIPETPSKTPAFQNTPAPAKTPATRKTPAPRKTPSLAKTPRMRKTPATSKNRTAQKSTLSKKTPSREQVLSSIDRTYDQSQFDIENVDSE